MTKKTARCFSRYFIRPGRSDARGWNRRHPVQRIQRRGPGAKPVDRIPLELPVDRSRRHAATEYAPQCGNRAALAGGEAQHQVGFDSFISRIVTSVVSVCRAFVTTRAGITASFAALARLAATGFGRMRFSRGLLRHIRGWSHAMLFRPSQLLSVRITAAIAPTLVRGLATADMALAGKRLAGFVDPRDDRRAESSDQIGAQHHGHRYAAVQSRTSSMPIPKLHARQIQRRRQGVSAADSLPIVRTRIGRCQQIGSNCASSPRC